MPERDARVPLLRLRDGALLPGEARALAPATAADEGAARAAVALHGGSVLVRGPGPGSGLGEATATLARIEPDPAAARPAIVRGLERVRLGAVETDPGGTPLAGHEPLPPSVRSGELERELAETLALARGVARHRRARLGTLAGELEERFGEADRLIDRCAERIGLDPTERGEILAERDALARARLLNRILRVRLEVDRTIDAAGVTDAEPAGPSGVATSADDDVRPRELGPRELAARDFEQRLAAARLPREASERFLRALDQFLQAPPGSVESTRTREYLDWMLELPWDAGERTGGDDHGQFDQVVRRLNESHTGLRSVKERIKEHLAVRRLAGRSEGTVLCFLGPPGTGKSSMGRALAEALGRQFVHVPVGTITEECELRGVPHNHDGAQAGSILEGLRRAGTTDAVVLLDEIDKLRLGGEGNAGGALQEILDREQNASFLDHYLGFPYDLSRCILLATATDAEEIAEPLADRLEILEFHGYTESEKLKIAREHILPRVRERAGLQSWQLRLTPAALLTIVRHYTEEAGVRNLARHLDSLGRKAALEVVRGGRGLYVRKGDLLRLLGPAIADEDLHPREPAVGLCFGLAWTSAGGSLLPVEALAMPGSGRLTLTGTVGDVLRESVQTAMSHVRTRFKSLGLRQNLLDALDLHMHFPSSATPKDGPSAGVAIAVALVSLLTAVPARHDVAMTGEISLHGKVLPVGGIREKMLAAVRAGLREVIVPARNAEEVLKLPTEVRRKLVIHMIDQLQDAFDLALEPAHATSLHSTKRAPARRRRAARKGPTRRRRKAGGRDSRRGS